MSYAMLINKKMDLKYDDRFGKSTSHLGSCTYDGRI